MTLWYLWLTCENYTKTSEICFRFWRWDVVASKDDYDAWMSSMKVQLQSNPIIQPLDGHVNKRVYIGANLSPDGLDNST